MGDENFIHDASGKLWNVPAEYIFRDRRTPVEISAEFFRELRHEMRHFHSSIFLNNMPTSTINLVCVGRREPNTERFSSMLWCVRFSFDTGSTLFPAKFGASFLWPLRKSTAITMHMDIRMREELQNVPHDERSLLVSLYTPKYPRCGFSQDIWNLCTPVTHLTDPRDRLFSMTVAPNTYESFKDAETDDVMAVDDSDEKPNNRGVQPRVCAQKSNALAGSVEFSKCADDVQYLIVDAMTDTLLKQNNVTHLMKMRCISKTFCKLIDQRVIAILNTLSNFVTKAHRTHSIVDICSARDAMMAYNVSPVQLMFEIALSRANSIQIGIHSFVRFQLDKKPNEAVPTPAKHKAQRLVEVFKRNAAVGRRVKRPLFRQMHAR
tara:strand:- start:57 stop:1190 length:1134 start_codon:yes stop_codon:yes gene_type:complete